jgi:hypothetical protein
MCLLRMSPDNTGRAVSAWLPYRMNGGYAFTTTFTYRISGADNGSGDGLAFGIHQDPRGTVALGAGGGNLGIYGANMIMPGLFVEIDTCTCLLFFVNLVVHDKLYLHTNNATTTIRQLQQYIDKNQFGLPADTFEQAVHVTITQNGQIVEVQELSTIMRNSNAATIITISSDGDTLIVAVDGVARVIQCVRLGEHFVGRDVSVGFTAGTGVVADQQDILTWTMDNVTPAANLVVRTARSRGAATVTAACAQAAYHRARAQATFHRARAQAAYHRVQLSLRFANLSHFELL